MNRIHGFEGLGGPPRYYFDRVVKLSLWKSLLDFFRHGYWQRERTLYRPVYPGQPGFDEAPYEMGFLFHPLTVGHKGYL